MKATDLMIGDLVTFKDCQNDKEPTIIKIWQINGGGDALAFIDGDKALDEIAIDEEIVGIPLTPKILEKNGWKIWYGDEKKKCPMYATWMADTSIMFEFYFHEGILREYWASDEAFATFPAGMNYLHQLQHALRLCRIEKEMEL